MQFPTVLTLLASSLLTTALPTDTSPKTNSILGDSSTVDVLVYPQRDCRGTPQTFTLGNIGPCRNTAFTYNSLSTTNVGQNMFNRGLYILAHPNQNCGSGNSGQASTPFRLTNGANCHTYQGNAILLGQDH